MPQCVGSDRLVDPGSAGDPPHDPAGTVPVQAPAIGGKEDRPFGTLADGQIDRPRGARCQRDGDDLAAFAGHHQGAVPALDTQSLDDRASGLRNPKPVQGQQRDEPMLGGRAEPGSNKKRAELLSLLRPMREDIVEVDSSQVATPLPSAFAPAPPL
jgi:hypothetical protein